MADNSVVLMGGYTAAKMDVKSAAKKAALMDDCMADMMAAQKVVQMVSETEEK